MKYILFLTWVLLVSGQAKPVPENDMELLLLHTIIRHGDRSPLQTFKSDPYQEDSWQFGGGGFGELSPLGIKQLLDLGKMYQEIYAKNSNESFLSREYNSREIYVRSTEFNRTIGSAMGFLAGFYLDNQTNPSSSSYMPIPVHTIDRFHDYVENVDSICPRYNKLWEMAKSSPVVQNFLKRPEISSLVDYLSNVTDTHIDIDYFWVIAEGLLCEIIHKEDMRTKMPWFNDDLFKNITDMNDESIYYINGVYDPPLIIDDLDIGLELRKIRGGSLMNEIKDRIESKIHCQLNHSPDCKWINSLKHYVYSGHDTTVYSFLTCMGVLNATVPKGLPQYAAATTIELWKNQSDSEMYFRVLYRKDENATLNSVTSGVPGCSGDYCPIAVFHQLAEAVKPDQNMNEWCNVLPTSSVKTRGELWSALLLPIVLIFPYFLKYSSLSE